MMDCIVLQSPMTLDLSSKAEAIEDHSPGAMKDDDDDDDDDGEDRIDSQISDPERLKAFNVSSFKMRKTEPHRVNLNYNNFLLFADVRATLRRRESGSNGSHFTPAARKSASHHRYFIQII